MTEGGKVLASRQRKGEALERQERVSEHDQGQMPMQAIPASPLEVIQATFLFGIFIKLLDDPTRMRQGDESL